MALKMKRLDEWVGSGQSMLLQLLLLLSVRTYIRLPLIDIIEHSDCNIWEIVNMCKLLDFDSGFCCFLMKFLSLEVIICFEHD
ncbi:hypothetical protein L1987_19862 [Smallanthus sonchifolius]|uniref:Uncharacterized protein n=1 Tax=Smallanthus sonchifolius TaxID=185202 RepID=A0ACB9IRX5_9ASTR|nr:hypothetical protein L1987_19862 [Smallanthus sonchifolius]